MTDLSKIEAENADLREVLADKRRLIRDLNKILDGTDSESLCDAVGVAQRIVAENAKYRAALQNIADQKIRGEFTDEEWDDVDGEPAWEDGHTGCVVEARSALERKVQS